LRSKLLIFKIIQKYPESVLKSGGVMTCVWFQSVCSSTLQDV